MTRRQKILSSRSLNANEAAELLQMVPIDMTEREREQPLKVTFYCSVCDRKFTTVWLHPDTTMVYDYEGHEHILNPEDLAEFKRGIKGR